MYLWNSDHIFRTPITLISEITSISEEASRKAGKLRQCYQKWYWQQRTTASFWTSLLSPECIVSCWQVLQSVGMYLLSLTLSPDLYCGSLTMLLFPSLPRFVSVLADNPPFEPRDTSSHCTGTLSTPWNFCARLYVPFFIHTFAAFTCLHPLLSRYNESGISLTGRRNPLNSGPCPLIALLSYTSNV